VSGSEDGRRSAARDGDRPEHGRPPVEDPITQKDPETQGSEVAEATEDQANQPGRFAAIFLLFRDLWRLLRGEEQRTRKLKWLFGLLRPYRGRVTVMAVALLVATAAGLAPPYLAGVAIDNGIKAGDLSTLDWIVAAYIASALLFWAATYAQTYLVGWVGQRALQNLREQIYTHLQTMSIGFFTRRKPGVLISRLTNDVEALDTLVTDGVVTLISSTLTLLGVVVILLFLDLPLALVTFATFPIRISRWRADASHFRWSSLSAATSPAACGATTRRGSMALTPSSCRRASRRTSGSTSRSSPHPPKRSTASTTSRSRKRRSSPAAW